MIKTYQVQARKLDLQPQTNSLIQELAEQAGYMKDSFGFGHWDMPECKKFAELIVRECAEVVSCNAHVSGFQLGDLLKQHFGVQ